MREHFTTIFLLLAASVCSQIPFRINSSVKIFVNQEGKKYFWNYSGQQVFLTKDYEVLEKFGWGYLVGYNAKLGLLNHSGKEIIPTAYTELAMISKSTIKVKDDSFTSEVSWKLFDTTGKEITNATKFDALKPFFGGNYYVTRNGKAALIDKSLNELTPWYDSAFYEGIRIPVEQNFFNAKRSFLLSMDYPNWIVPVRLNGNWGWIDTTSKPTTSTKYSKIGKVHLSGDGYSLQSAKVYWDGQQGFVNAIGQEITNYDSVSNYSEGMTCVRRKGKWGFIDLQKKEKISCKYEAVRPFIGGRAATRINGKWGYINKKGKVVAPFKYDSAENLSNGLAIVRMNKKCGLINAEGKELTSIKYDTIDFFNDGLAKVAEGRIQQKWSFIDTMGKELFLPKFEKVQDFKGNFAPAKLLGKWGLINRSGYELTAFVYDTIILFSRNIAFAKQKENYEVLNNQGKPLITGKNSYWQYYRYGGFIKIKQEGKFGIFDSVGRQLTPIIFDEIEDLDVFKEYFSDDCRSGLSDYIDGLARVRINNYYGLINRKGKEVIPVKYEYVSEFYDGIAYVKQNGKFGLIDSTGKSITQVKYDHCPSQYKGTNFYLIHVGSKKGLINKTGLEIIPPKYDAIEFEEKGRVILVNRDLKWGIIDRQGKEIMFSKFYHQVDWLRNCQSGKIKTFGLFSARINGKSGVIDSLDREVIPVKYEILGDDCFAKGWRDVKETGKQNGFMDNAGNIKFLDKSYDDVHIVWRNLARVNLKSKFGLINLSGKEVTSLKYDEMDYDYRNGLMMIKVDGKYGLVDTAGKEVVAPKYETIDFSFPKGYVKVRSENKWGVLDYKGKEILPLRYNWIAAQDNGVVTVELEGRSFRINSHGIEIK